MKIFKYSLHFVLIVILCYGCQKESQTNQTSSNINFTQKEALASYQQFKNQLQALSPKDNIALSVVKIDKKDNPFELLVNTAYESATKEFNFVEFDIKYKFNSGLIPEEYNINNDIKIMEAKVDRLVIKENKKSGIIDYELVSYIPSNDVIAKPYNLKANQLNKLDIEFDGYILHKNIGGEIILLEKIKAGILEKKLYKTINKNRLLKTQGIKNDNTTYCSSYCFREIVYEPTFNCYIRDYVCFSECYEVTNFPGVTIDNGVVSFESNQSFFEAYTSLDNSVEQHNSNFYDSKEDKTDEEVDMISTQVNFDDVKPLRDFENLYGIASLRQKIQNEENIWLENSVLNPNTDPDVLYSEPDDVMRTFFNQNQTLKIAGIYRGTPSDGVLTTNSGGSSSECRSHARYSESNENHMYDNNTRSAKLVASFNGLYLGLAGTRIIARTKNFKKKSNGNWKKFATSCYAGIGGQVVNVNCYGNMPFSTTDEGYKRRRSYKASKIDANVPSYIKVNEMMGVHEVRFKLTYQRYFTW